MRSRDHYRLLIFEKPQVYRELCTYWLSASFAAKMTSAVIVLSPSFLA